MDVNGTRFHLVYGREDWRQCCDESLAEGGFELDSQGIIRLRPLIRLFPRGRRSLLLDPSSRRGAAADRFGNWYWISADREKLYWSPSGSRRAQVYWQQERRPVQSQSGEFVPQLEPAPAPVLSGLAVTTLHYLVVGCLEPAGLLVFDLHRGGEPLWLHFPAGVPFAPFDMTAAPNGELWVLDRENQGLWGLDRYFRLLPLHTGGSSPPPGGAGFFYPVEEPDQPAIPAPLPPLPQRFVLAADEPIAVEMVNSRELLVLGPPTAAASGTVLYHYRLDAAGQLGLASPPLPLPDLQSVSVISDEAPLRPVVGYDMAYLPATQQLYVVERDGNQVIAYTLTLPAETGGGGAMQLTPQALYLPLHYFGGRALAAVRFDDCPQAVFYDVTSVVTDRDGATRWIRLQEIDQPRYARSALLLTTPFDSHQRGCTWHRLFLDACIPPETAVQVWTRAGDDEALLKFQPFQPEPALYRRWSGAELPYYDPYPARAGETSRPLENSGTWELLLQEAVGRFLEVQLVLKGNGRASPAIQALRVYYPRFSYPKNFLPAVYQDERDSAWFLERMLANTEGFYSEIEGKIAAVSTLFDARSAAPEALDWLAHWVGLVLDPLWSRISAEEPLNGLPPTGMESRRPDRRRLLIRFVMQLYARRGTPDGLRFALLLLLDPCLETRLRRLQDAAVQPDVGLRLELGTLGLPYPTPAMTRLEVEDIFYRYLLAGSRASGARIVERWQAREGRAVAAGLATAADQPQPVRDLQSEVEAAAHYFSVLIPEGLSAELSSMVERIINLEKPAHTRFDILRFWDYFRVGEARLGIDTELGEEGRFLPIVLGRDYLAEGYLEAAHPMDVAERPVIDRDRLQERPN